MRGRSCSPPRKRSKTGRSNGGRNYKPSRRSSGDQEALPGTSQRNLRPRRSVTNYNDGDRRPPTYPFESDYEKLANMEIYRNNGTVLEMDAKEFTLDYVNRTGLNQPILFTGQLDELNMKIPNFTPKDLEERISTNERINIYNNSAELETTTSLSNFLREYEKPYAQRSDPLNTAIKIAHMELSTFVQAPSVIRQIDWWRTIFPSQKFDARNLETSEKLILLPMAGACANFHTENSGAGAWFHVQRGHQYYFLIPPEDQNIEKLYNWTFKEECEGFFAEKVDLCAAIKVEAGQTLIIPSGWIHAIYSPIDCIVYGGSFLYEHSLGMQLNIYKKDVENKAHFECFYPFYIQILWYYIAEFVKQACGREYVRLLNRAQFLALRRSRSDPNQCYDIDVEPPEYYDKEEGCPIQKNFDEADKKPRQEPTSFNDEYLKRVPKENYKDLLNLADLFASIMCEPESMKVAEGIRRPNHLLKDFAHILGHLVKLQAESSRVESPPPVKRPLRIIEIPPNTERPSRAERSPSIEYLGTHRATTPPVKRSLPVKGSPIREITGNLLLTEESAVSPIASPAHSEHSQAAEQLPNPEDQSESPEEKSFFMQKSEHEPTPSIRAKNSSANPQFPQSPHQSDQEPTAPVNNDDLGQILFNFCTEDNHDCVIRAGRQELKCFKVVLMARSERLKQELQLLGSSIAIVDFGEMPPNVVKALIEWIYKGWSESTAEHVEELYKLAVEWKFSKLKSDCVNQIKATLNDGNFCARLIMAFDVEEEELQTQVLAYGRRMQNVSSFLLRSSEWKPFAFYNQEKSNFIVGLLNTGE